MINIYSSVRHPSIFGMPRPTEILFVSNVLAKQTNYRKEEVKRLFKHQIKIKNVKFCQHFNAMRFT